MATYVLIHGAGDVGWYWHLVEAELRGRRHDVVVMALPAADESAGLAGEAVLVAQSFAGSVAPLVCSRVPTRQLVLVAGTIPAKGERRTSRSRDRTRAAEPSSSATFP